MFVHPAPRRRARLAAAETAGKAFAAKAGCPDQSAACLRQLPVDALVSNFPGAASCRRYRR